MVELIVIPKSVHQDRIAANFDVSDFELTPADMSTIAAWIRATAAPARTRPRRLSCFDG